MPPKKAKSPTGAIGQAKKKEDLATVPIHNDWSVNIQILVENRLSDGEHLKALSSAVSIPLRKRFSILSYEEMLAKVEEYGDPKNKKPQKPLSCSEICEEIFQCQERSEEVTALMWAKLIKFGILAIKSSIKTAVKTALAKKDSVAVGNPGKEKSGKEKDKKGDKGGKRGSTKGDDSSKSHEKDWSTLKKRNEIGELCEYIDDEPTDGPEHYILITGFHQAQILPMLEEILVFPSGIIRIQAENYEELAALTEVRAKPTLLQTQEEVMCAEEIALQERKKELATKNLRLFWRLLPYVFNYAKKTSKLYDVATYHCVVPSEILPTDWQNQHKMRVFSERLFDLVANLVYDGVENLRQYRNFLQNLELIAVPSFAPAARKKQSITTGSELEVEVSASPAPGAAPTAAKKRDPPPAATADTSTAPPSQQADSGSSEQCQSHQSAELDMRYYKDLMDSVPMESVSVPLVLHCIMEQVVATEDGKIPPSERLNAVREDQMDSQLADHITTALEQISFTAEEEKAIAKDFPKMKERLAKEKLAKNSQHKSSSGGPVIIRYQDEVAARTHHLADLPDIAPIQVEEEMLSRTFASKLVKSCPPVEGANERSARLHELMRQQAEGGGGGLLTSGMMDRGFRQFVFESMPLSHLDKNGNVVKVRPNKTKDNFWDDPYDLIICEAESMLQRSDVNDEMIDDLIEAASAQMLTREDAQGLRNRLKDKSAKKSPSRGEEEGMNEAAILYQAITTHNQLSPRRYFDEFVYSEHMSNKVLLQVLEEVRPMYPCMDTYHHKRDNSLLVVFHHPISNQLDAKTNWFRSLYSDVGFRNYQDHVATSITDWTMEQDAVYEKARMAEELRKALEKRAAETRPNTPPEPKKGASKENSVDKKSDEISGKDDDSANPFLLPGSLKYENETKPKDMLDTQGGCGPRGRKDRRKSSAAGGRRKSGKKGKLSAKSSRNVSPATSRKNSQSSRKKSKSGKSPRSTPSPARSKTVNDLAESVPVEKKRLPFSGYNVGNDLIQIRGEETFVYPSDGGVVSTQRFQYEHGRNYIRVKVCKDGHVFTCHVIEPKDHKADGELTRLLAGPRRIEICEDGSDAAAELSDRRRVLDKSRGTDCHAEFGSTCAVFCDRMTVSFSLHGESGHCCHASELKVKIARMLQGLGGDGAATNQSVRESSAMGGGKTSPPSASVGGRKRSSPRKSSKTLEDESGVERKASDASENRESTQHTKSQFPQLYVSCPDGLALCYDNFGGPKQRCAVAAPNPFVRQHYPVKTKPRTATTCSKPLSPGLEEQSRLIMNDGTVVKVMLDGSIRILCLNGTVHTNRPTVVAGHSPAGGGPDVISTPRSGCATHDHTPTPSPAPATPSTPGGGRKSTGKGPRKPSVKNADGERRTSTGTQGSGADGPQKADTEIDLSTCWQTTRITGEVYVVKDNGCAFLKGKRTCYTAQDPVTKEILLSLEDRVMRVARPDGGVVCDHEDGTRITRFCAPNNDGRTVWYVKVECVGFATVTFDQTTKESFTVFGSGSTLTVTQDGNYKLYHWTGGNLTLNTKGAAIYNPAVEDEDQAAKQSVKTQADSENSSSSCIDEHAYILRHNAPVCFEMIDCAGNLFQVKNNGEVSTYNPNAGEGEEEDGGGSRVVDPKQEYLNKYINHPPRLFIIRKDGTGSELLRHRDLETFIRSAEANPVTAVIRESVIGDSGAIGLTVMRPHPSEIGDVWWMEPEEKDIVPPNIRTRDLERYDFRKPLNFGCIAEFGKKTGKGLTITPRAPSGGGGGGPMAPLCPDALETRQLIRHPEIARDVRKMLRSKFMEFVGDLEIHEIHRKSLHVQDPRAEDEVMRANNLLTLVLEYDDGLKECFVTPVQMPDADAHCRTMKKEDHERHAIHEERITPSYVRPEGEDEAMAMKKEYEASLRIKTPPTVRKATPTLSKEVWNVIRAQIMEEKHDRDALKGKIVPPYFVSEEGRAWLISQTRNLNESAAAITYDQKRRKKGSITVALAENDNPVYVGKRQIDKIHVSDKGVNEINKYRRASAVQPEKQSPLVTDSWNRSGSGKDYSRPGNPTPANTDQLLSHSDLAASMDPKYRSFLQQIEDSHEPQPYNPQQHRLRRHSDRRHSQSATFDSNESPTYSDPVSLGSSIRQILHKLDQEENSDMYSRTSDIYQDFNVLNWPPVHDNENSTPPNSKVYPDDTQQDHLYGRVPENLPLDSETHILQDFYRPQPPKRSATKPPATNNAVYYCQQMAYNEDAETRGGNKNAMMKSLLAHNPKAVLNTKFLEVEEPVRRQINISSIAGPLDKGNVKVLRRGFQLVPREINFGILKEGEAYQFAVKLRNVGIDSCRYKIRQPPPGTGISIKFTPGMVAAGLEVPLTVNIYAIAAGVNGNEGIGRINHQLEVVAETDIFHLPISAILTAHEYERVYGNQQQELQIAPGVVHLGSRRPSGPSRGSGDMV